jgi:hypothetical protein
VAFLFRVVVIFHNEYPPSTDIGLHSNIINLIIDDGKLPTWNPYHMGGEPLTNTPGFYLFASIIIFFTGMPLLVAQALIAAFFSSFAIFPTYLFAKKIWRSKGAGFLAALFVAVSSLSLEMLGWGGYPNVVSLVLIAIVFYLFLENTSQPCILKLLVTALLVGGIIITHLLSFFVLFSVLTLYIILLLVGKALRLKELKSLNATLFLASVILGALIVSPWLLTVFRFYFDMATKGVFFGGIEENRSLTLTNRSVDVSILVFSAIVIPAIFMFKASRQKYIDSDSLLFITWYLVPLFLTQSYVVGIITDYLRFMYFVDFPALLILAAVMLYVFRYTSVAIQKLFSTKWDRNGKTVVNMALPAILLVVYLISPLSITPALAITRTEFYSTVRKPEGVAINWIQQRTANSAILASDHLYGWWLSGVAKRSTLSAVSPEFLLYPNEIEVAKSMLILLDTDFCIDNGLIRVLDDGGYLGRHNPMFMIDRQNGITSSIFHFNDSEITVFVQRKTINQAIDLSNVETFETHLDSKDGNSAVLSLIRQNDFIKVNKTLTVRRGVRFAELSYKVEGIDGETTINWMRFIVHLKEGRSVVNQQMMSLLDYYAWVNGKIIFKDIYPQTKIYTYENPSSAELLYSTNNVTSLKVTFLVGVYDLWGMQYKDIMEMIGEVPDNPMRIESNSPVVASNYLDIIKEHSITYIVCRDQEIYPKFADDPHFQTVYKNVHVAIFKVAEHELSGS